VQTHPFIECRDSLRWRAAQFCLAPFCQAASAPGSATDTATLKAISLRMIAATFLALAKNLRFIEIEPARSSWTADIIRTSRYEFAVEARGPVMGAALVAPV
jgi:hypothetical protein